MVRLSSRTGRLGHGITLDLRLSHSNQATWNDFARNNSYTEHNGRSSLRCVSGAYPQYAALAALALPAGALAPHEADSTNDAACAGKLLPLECVMRS